MAAERLSQQQIERLAEDVRAKILSQKTILAHAQGEIAIRAFLKGEGFDIKITVTS